MTPFCGLRYLSAVSSKSSTVVLLCADMVTLSRLTHHILLIGPEASSSNPMITPTSGGRTNDDSAGVIALAQLLFDRLRVLGPDHLTTPASLARAIHDCSRAVTMKWRKCLSRRTFWTC
jgi:hypothetical protein